MKHIWGVTASESSTFYTIIKTVITRKPTLKDQRAQDGKVGFAAVFPDITRRMALFKEKSIHTAEMTAIKIAWTPY